MAIGRPHVIEVWIVYLVNAVTAGILAAGGVIIDGLMHGGTSRPNLALAGVLFLVSAAKDLQGHLLFHIDRLQRRTEHRDPPADPEARP